MSFNISKVEKLPDSEVVITGEIPLDFLNQSRVEAIKHLNEHTSLPGFRAGKIPEDVLVKNVGEMRILEEAAEVALGKEYGHIVEESKLRPLARPKISVTKLAPNIPLEFRMELIVEPEFTLPDYKKIASEVSEDDTEKKRIKILENIADATVLTLPQKFIDSETHHMLHHFQHDLEKAGIKWAQYLEQIKKTEEEMRSEWMESVKARAKRELILSRIAEKENLKSYRDVFEFLEKKS